MSVVQIMYIASESVVSLIVMALSSLVFFLTILIIILIIKIKQAKRQPALTLDATQLMNALTRKGSALCKVSYVDDANVMLLSPRMKI